MTRMWRSAFSTFFGAVELTRKEIVIQAHERRSTASSGKAVL